MPAKPSQSLNKFGIFALILALLLLMALLPPLVMVMLTLPMMLLGFFTLLTGWGLPGLKGRWRGFGLIMTAMVVGVTASLAFTRQQETRWAELRQTDSEAYLAEMATVNRDRWLEALRDLHPAAYEAEILRHAQEEAEATSQIAADAEAQRIAEAARTAEPPAEARSPEAVQATSSARLAEADFYWDADSNRYRAEIVTIVNRIAEQHARCREPDPESVTLSSTRSSPGAPVFFVTCGLGMDAFNIWFSPEDAATDRAFRAVQHVDRGSAVDACENAARARANHPSTVRFSRLMSLSFVTYNSGRARVVSRFTARNSFNLELGYTIDCLFEGNRMIEVNIFESAA